MAIMWVGHSDFFLNSENEILSENDFDPPYESGSIIQSQLSNSEDQVLLDVYGFLFLTKSTHNLTLLWHERYFLSSP